MRLLMSCLGCAALPMQVEAASADLRNPPLDYVIVITGGEILDGVYSDAHTPFLTRTLRASGGRCLGTMTVDDRRGDLIAALGFAAAKAPLVIVTGGLGPTPNDITRETIADFTGIGLQEREEVVAGMERRFNQPRDQLRPNLRRQALVPVSGGYLSNSTGTAVGLLFDTTNGIIAALPGPPRELQPMVERELVPFLQTRFGVRPAGSRLTLRFAGLGQSQISQTLQEKVTLPPDLVITSRFEAGRVDFTFSLPGQTEAEKAWLNELARTMRGELGDHLYAENDTTLEEQVVLAFARRGLTLALVEIGSGGHVTSGFAGTPRLDRVLQGSMIVPSAPSLCRILGLPGETSIDGMAQAARVRIGTDVAILIDLTSPSPGDRSSARVTWVGGDHRETRFPWADTSSDSLKVLTTSVLDWLRRQVELSGGPERKPEG